MRDILVLPIKKKWFDMILSGEKTEEYREIKPYYTSRFWKVASKWPPTRFNQAEQTWIPILFRNGYSKKSPSLIALVTFSIGTGKPEWGAVEGKEYYILNIHNIIKE